MDEGSELPQHGTSREGESGTMLGVGDLFSSFETRGRDQRLKDVLPEHYQEDVLLLSLPVELLLNVLVLLDPPDIGNAAATCNMMACLLRKNLADAVWEGVHARCFGGRSAAHSFKASCIKLHRLAQKIPAMVAYVHSSAEPVEMRLSRKVAIKPAYVLEAAFDGDHVVLAQRCFAAMGEWFSPLSPAILLSGGKMLPLRVAVDRGSPELVRLLLAMGADVHQTVSGGAQDGRSAFVAAIENDQRGMVELMRNAAIRELDSLEEGEKERIMIAIIRRGNLDLLQECYARGCALQPLHVDQLKMHFITALLSNNLEVVKFVSDRTMQVQCYNTPLKYLGRIGRQCCCEILSFARDKNVFTEEQWDSILRSAAEKGRLNVLLHFVRRHSRSVLFEELSILAERGVGSAQPFLELLAAVESGLTTEQNTMLLAQLCFMRGDASESEILLLLEEFHRMGADANGLIEAYSLSHMTPLTKLMAYGRDVSVSIVRFLLQHGADVNARAPAGHGSFFAGSTPLMALILCQRSMELWELFLAHGADLRLCDNNGNTALHFFFSPRAVAFGNCEEHALQVLQTILDAGVDANAVSTFSALEYAAWNGYPMEHIRMLLEHGADVNTFVQQPLLQSAAARGDMGVLRLLTSAGADFSLLKRGYWETSLTHEIRQFLEEHGYSFYSG